MFGYSATFQQDAVLAKVFDCRHIVTDEKDGTAAFANVFHFAQAFLLKFSVTDRKHFVDHKYLRFKERRHG